MSRETIYAALFNKLKAVPGFVTTSRRLLHWADVPAADQPALFVIQKNEAVEQKRGLPPKWRFYVDAYVYVNSGNDSDVVPATALNGLIDGIEAALTPDHTGFQTLGGLVSHAWIYNAVQTDEGFLGPQAVARIPIEILVNV